jgi:hypothetical protein
MAQEPRSDGGAEFVRRIVTDPNSVPDVMRLYGYLGASSEPEHDRLYLSPDLTNYVEVPTSAILHRMAIPAAQDPHGAVTLWVKRDAALVYKMAPAAQALAHYFAGAINAQAAMGGAAGGADAGFAAGPAAIPGLPPSPLDGCQPQTLQQAFCGLSPVAPCTVAGCPTQARTQCLPCATQVHSQCLPCLTQAHSQCVPCVTIQATPCLPCQTQAATPCVPCLTQAQTPCLPCVTRVVTQCLPCPTRVASCAPLCTHQPSCATCVQACTPATCNPNICGASPGIGCSAHCGTRVEPACSAHPPVCSAVCAVQAAAPAAAQPAAGMMPQGGAALMPSFGPECGISWGVCSVWGGCQPHVTQICTLLGCPPRDTIWVCSAAIQCM